MYEIVIPTRGDSRHKEHDHIDMLMRCAVFALGEAGRHDDVWLFRDGVQSRE